MHEAVVGILQNKNSASRFQILVEIATHGPGISQKSIAAKLGFTPQAISDYIHQLPEEVQPGLRDFGPYPLLHWYGFMDYNIL